MRKIVISAAAVLAAAMFQMPVMAAPMDELNEILTSQMELCQDSLLAETIGWKDLGNAIKEKGLSFSMAASLTRGTAEALGEAGSILEDAYVELGVQADPNEKEWLLRAGFGVGDTALGDLELYGSSERLAVSVPQLFEGALALHAGNLKEQYAGSALEALIGEGTSEQIPEINTKFYPEASDLELLTSVGSSFEAVLLQELEAVEEQVQVEKTEEEEHTVYVMTMPAEAVEDIYSTVLEQYLSLIRQTQMLEVTEIYELEDQMEQVMDLMSAVMPENLELNFYTKDGLLEKIFYEVDIDTTALEEMEGTAAYDMQNAEENGLDEAAETEVLADAVTDETAKTGTPADEAETEILTDVVVEELAEAGIVDWEEASENPEADTVKSTISYEIVFNEPSCPMNSADFRMIMMNEGNEDDVTAVQMQLRTTEEAERQQSAVTFEVSAGEEVLYSGTIYEQSFDAATGDFDVIFRVGDEQEEAAAIRLDSTFTGVETGKSFTWKLDGLTVSADGETAGLAGEVKISADPGEIAVPSQERVLLDLDENELMGLAMEVMQNAQTWMTQLESAAENYDMESEDSAGEAVAADEDDLYEENAEENYDAEEEPDGTRSVVIGGADGPTSIFLAGKVS